MTNSRILLTVIVLVLLFGAVNTEGIRETLVPPLLLIWFVVLILQTAFSITAPKTAPPPEPDKIIIDLSGNSNNQEPPAKEPEGIAPHKLMLSVALVIYLMWLFQINF